MTNAADRDTPDLEALFDSIVDAREPAQPGAAKAAKPARPARAAAAPAEGARAARKKPAQPGADVSPFVTLSVARKASEEHRVGTDEELVQRIGHLTRSLHDSLRELGYDKKIETAAAAIPDTRDRLAYVANLTGQAADKVLTLTEGTIPLQDALGRGARGLSGRWQALMDNQLTVAEFKELVAETRDYLADVPTQTGASSRNLRDIMVAQDFHDLTGQVIRKITEMAQNVEAELINLLVDSVSPEVRAEIVEGNGLMNGPVIKADGRNDIVADQAQVDDLLASLGF